MAHKITYPITLDSNIQLSSMHCFPVPSLNNLDQGKIAFDLRFYKDRESRFAKYSRIYPLHNNALMSSFIKQLTGEELMSLEGMTTKIFNTWVRDYFINLYGFWNVYEEDYESLTTITLTNTSNATVIIVDTLLGEVNKLTKLRIKTPSEKIIKIQTIEETPRVIHNGVITKDISFDQYITGYIEPVYETIDEVEVLISDGYNTYSLFEQTENMQIQVSIEDISSEFEVELEYKNSIL